MCPTDQAVKLLLELVAMGVAVHFRKSSIL